MIAYDWNPSAIAFAVGCANARNIDAVEDVCVYVAQWVYQLRPDGSIPTWPPPATSPAVDRELFHRLRIRVWKLAFDDADARAEQIARI